jgi:FimV-like protein
MGKWLFAIAVVASLVGISKGQSPTRHAEPSTIEEVDRLFSWGEDPSKDRRALDLIEQALAADGKNYQMLWRASRSYYHVAERATKKDRTRIYGQGIGAGEKATAAEANGVEGHYWLGANIGGYCEEVGGIGAFRNTKRLRAEMEAVVRLQPDYDRANAFLALGQLDCHLPRLLGGSLERGTAYLERGLQIWPQNFEIKLALAQAYMDAGRRDEARRQLNEIIAGPPGTNRDQARKLLTKL